MESFSMVEAVYKMINTGLTVAALPLDEINMSNSHVFFIVHNLFNEFRTELSLATYYFVNNMVQQTQSKTDTFITLLFFSALTPLLGILLLFPTLNKVNQSQLEVLVLFMDIPETVVKQMHRECDQFLFTLQDDKADIRNKRVQENFKKNVEQKTGSSLEGHEHD